MAWHAIRTLQSQAAETGIAIGVSSTHDRGGEEGRERGGRKMEMIMGLRALHRGIQKQLKRFRLATQLNRSTE